MVRSLLLASWAFALGLPSLCTAGGAKTEMYSCVYYKVDPETPFEVKFTSGASGDKCMAKKGSDAKARVTSKGLTCAGLGVVEEETDGTCYFKDSYWGTSYEANGISGATNSQWSDSYSDAYIELQSYSNGTNVCTSKTNCQALKQRWDFDTKSDIYIVFQPEYAGSSALFTVQKPEL